MAAKTGQVVLLRAKGKGHLTFHGAGIAAQALCNFAHEFFVASQKVKPPVSWYLLGHALELFLKAYLRAGSPGLDLKDYGHSLTKVLDACKATGLESGNLRITPALARDVAAFSAIYAGKRLEYVGLGDLIANPWARMPDLRRVRAFTRLLDSEMNRRAAQRGVVALYDATHPVRRPP